MCHTLTAINGCTEDGTGRGTPIAAITIGGGQVTHTLSSEGADASEDGTGRGTPIVVTPLALRGRDGGTELEAGEPNAPANALRSAGGGGSLYPLVSISQDDTPHAVHENVRGEITTPPVMGSLTVGGGKPGQGYPAIRAETIVRRLTPLECERLQGYPDGWTDNGQVDSSRYRQLGNSVAVPCVEWIARRLVQQHKGGNTDE